jgi:membrane peptidoglycan carboxypeptidase
LSTIAEFESLWQRFGRRVVAGLLLVAVAGLVLVLVDEVRTSRRQAERLSAMGRELHFEVQPGPSTAIRFPGPGPFDERMGYRQLPGMIERLAAQGYGVSAQAHMSPRMLALADEGLFPPYHEKAQGGLELRDCRAEPLFSARYPERVYDNFEAVPPLLVNALLFIENRELLDPRHPTRNPAIEWDRFGKAIVDQMLHRVDDAHPAPGGSTLATQIEKYRHSPEGRTDSAKEKLRQMASASLRAYLDGQNTMPRRRQIVVDYLNTVPLSAKAGFGEVNGLGDGLWVWYGRDFSEINQLLKVPVSDTTVDLPQRRALAFKQALLGRQAGAFKQALSLMIAQRRPSYYLAEGELALAILTDSYLRVMADSGVIPPALRDAALAQPLKLQPQLTLERPASFVERKAATAVRTKLQGLLGVQRSYDLDRFDLAVSSSLDGDVQRAATALLRGLKDPVAAHAAGLYGFRLLTEGDDTSKITFSFTLFERSEHANLLRVQTDNVDQPFDLNEGARLDLGSTAKLRTLVTYLELVAELHGQWSKLDAKELAALDVNRKDPLAWWAREYLQRTADKSLAAMLDAAMQRTYSASPYEGFFTGSGLHHFENFEPEDNRRVLTVREAVTRSVNLVFIRLMRDVVHRVMFRSGDAGAVLLSDKESPARQEYLARFADKEGREFIARFYRKYQGKPALEAEDLLLQNHRLTPVRLTSIFFGLEPQADAKALDRFLERRLGSDKFSDAAVQALQDKYGAGRWSLGDRGYLAGLHPLELWVVGYLRHHPKATLSEVIGASREERQDVYAWLFKTRHKNAQDLRIRSLIELEAFIEIHRMWKRLGYPFEALTPSYATALGASGDRPAALAEIMGIIVNRGVRLPSTRVNTLEFARGTPYETRLDYQPTQAAERVLSPEIADTVRRAIITVVEDGTAKRLKGVFARRDGTVLPVGGKTGTGDHRFDIYGRGGQLVSSRVVNRTATLVFLIGDRYFGTMMAYVHEPYAAKYKFTSALPAQLLKALSPALLPLLEDDGTCRAASAEARR